MATSKASNARELSALNVSQLKAKIAELGDEMVRLNYGEDGDTRNLDND
jgi:uncharacterized small protein (DUF1192 family)